MGNDHCLEPSANTSAQPPTSEEMDPNASGHGLANGDANVGESDAVTDGVEARNDVEANGINDASQVADVDQVASGMETHLNNGGNDQNLAASTNDLSEDVCIN